MLVANLGKIRRAVPVIENKVKIKIGVGKNGVSVSGSELDEYLVEKVLVAVDFGFDVEDALLLMREDFVPEFIDVKGFSHRKNLRDVRARLIGRSGKAKKTIENLTGAVIVVNGNRVGVIVDADNLDSVVQAIESLICGAKHGNVFARLEKQNVLRRRFDNEDLGLKISR